VQNEKTGMLQFFEKVKVCFEGTDSYQPVEWIKNKMPPSDYNGIEIKRPFTNADKGKFIVKIILDLECSPRRFTLSPQLASILGI